MGLGLTITTEVHVLGHQKIIPWPWTLLCSVLIFLKHTCHIVILILNIYLSHTKLNEKLVFLSYNRGVYQALITSEKIKKQVGNIDCLDGNMNSGALWNLKKDLFPQSRDPPTAMIDPVTGNLLTDGKKIQEAAF